MNVGSGGGVGSMGAGVSNGKSGFALGQNFLVIDCNYGKPIADGFKHTVYRKLMINGNKTFEYITDVKFSEVIGFDYVEQMRKDPVAFIAYLQKESEQ